MNDMYDEYGCCNSCGYTYCDVLDECIRVWETECSTGNRRLTQMADFNINELMLFIGGVLGSLGALLLVLQKSKCKSVCWGCCVRDVDAVIQEEKLELTGHTGDTPRRSERLKNKNENDNKNLPLDINGDAVPEPQSKL